MKDYLLRSFQYSEWANQRTMNSLRDCIAAQAEGLPIFAHVLAAEHIWHSRLSFNEPAYEVWPSLTFEACQTLMAQNARNWADYFEGLNGEKLNASIEYQNIRGEFFRDSILDILTHVTVHGGYHRGQLAKTIVRNGGIAAATDFIIFARSSRASAT